MYPTLRYSASTYRIDNLGGGIAIDCSEDKIPDNKSPDMLNMYYDGNILRKREGQMMLFYDENILSSSKDSFYSHFIYHAGDKIKSYNYITKEINVLIGKVKKIKGTFFIYNGYLYYIGTGEYYKISYDSETETLKAEVVSGFIPTVLINCSENSVGDELDAYNYLTSAFKATYNTTSSTKYIKMPDLPLDSTKDIVITFDSKEIKNFSVDWINKTIAFGTELKEGHNLLEIVYHRSDVSDDREKITQCNICESFGGYSAGISEGTRVFVSGNSKYANTFFYSELKNPEYFPVTQFELLGDDNDPIMCMGKQYNGLVFFKKKSIYISYYEYSNGEVVFSVSRLNSNIGCDCKYTLETVDNQLVWLNSIWGVMTLSSTNIKDEKNVKCISQNINGRDSFKALLMQENLENTVGFVNRGKYYLVTGIFTYVLNITNNFSIALSGENMSWFLMDNISAKDYVCFNREVYLAGDKGFSYFKDVLYDFDINTPIKAHFTTKAIDFNNPVFFKNIFDIAFSLKSINNSYFKVELKDENGNIGSGSEYIISKFNFLNFSYPQFTFCANLFSFVFKRKISRSRTKYLMIKFSNNKKNSQMILSDISITYSPERSVRFNGI